MRGADSALPLDGDLHMFHHRGPLDRRQHRKINPHTHTAELGFRVPHALEPGRQARRSNRKALALRVHVRVRVQGGPMPFIANLIV